MDVPNFSDAQFAQSEADLLFSVTVANRPGYVYLLIEHQSSPDGWMLLRLLSPESVTAGLLFWIYLSVITV
jgi:predicted transposase YdaD